LILIWGLEGMFCMSINLMISAELCGSTVNRLSFGHHQKFYQKRNSGAGTSAIEF